MSDFRTSVEATIRRYYEGCNAADVDKMRSCFSPDATHYFPRGAPQGPFVSAAAIAEGWKQAVETLGSYWVGERLAIDEVRRVAILEWTHYKTSRDTYLRGDEWFEFDEQGRITEIRAYYAAAPGPSASSHELGGFDYRERGYSTAAPAGVR